MRLAKWVDHQDAKKLGRLKSDADPDDYSVIDEVDYKMSTEFPAPMFVQHTEAMLEEIDRMVSSFFL